MVRTRPLLFGHAAALNALTYPNGHTVKIEGELAVKQNRNLLYRHWVYHRTLMDVVQVYFTFAKPSRTRAHILELVSLIHELTDGCGLPGATGYTLGTPSTYAAYRTKKQPAIYYRPDHKRTSASGERWALWTNQDVHRHLDTRTGERTPHEVSLRMVTCAVHHEFVTHTATQYWEKYLARQVGLAEMPLIMEDIHSIRSMLEYWSPEVPNSVVSEVLTISPLSIGIRLRYASLLVKDTPTKLNRLKAEDIWKFWRARMLEWNAWLRRYILEFASLPFPQATLEVIIRAYEVDPDAFLGQFTKQQKTGGVTSTVPNYSTWWNSQYGRDVFTPSKRGVHRIDTLQTRWCMAFVRDMMPQFLGKPSLRWWERRINALSHPWSDLYPGPPDKWGIVDYTGVDSHVTQAPYEPRQLRPTLTLSRTLDPNIQDDTASTLLQQVSTSGGQLTPAEADEFAALLEEMLGNIEVPLDALDLVSVSRPPLAADPFNPDQFLDEEGMEEYSTDEPSTSTNPRRKIQRISHAVQILQLNHPIPLYNTRKQARSVVFDPGFVQHDASAVCLQLEDAKGTVFGSLVLPKTHSVFHRKTYTLAHSVPAQALYLRANTEGEKPSYFRVSGLLRMIQ